MGKESMLLQEKRYEKNPELIIDVINSLQDLEREECRRLDAVKSALQKGKIISKYEIKHLVSTYEKLQQEAEYQRKIQWTLDVIKKLQQAKIGIFEKLDAIKNRLEEGEILYEYEINYLKENWKLLRKTEQ